MPVNGEDRRFPPMDGLVAAANVEGTATAAAVIANGPIADAGGCGFNMTFENCGDGEIHIIFGRNASMNAPTTTANAGRIRPGEEKDFYIGTGVTHWRAIGSAAGQKLRYWRS